MQLEPNMAHVYIGTQMTTLVMYNKHYLTNTPYNMGLSCYPLTFKERSLASESRGKILMCEFPVSLHRIKLCIQYFLWNSAPLNDNNLTLITLPDIKPVPQPSMTKSYVATDDRWVNMKLFLPNFDKPKWRLGRDINRYEDRCDDNDVKVPYRSE